MATTLADQIATKSAQPKRAQNDAGSVEVHSIPDQIAADIHQRKAAAAKLAPNQQFSFSRVRFGSEV